MEGKRVASAAAARSRRCGAWRLFAACAASVLTPNAWANNDTWKTAASGTWNFNSSWTDGSVPGANDQATVNNLRLWDYTQLKETYEQQHKPEDKKPPEKN